MFEILKNVFWVLLLGVALWALWRGKKLGYKPDMVWWAKHWDKVFTAVLVAVVVFLVVGCTSGAKEPAPPAVAAVNCQGSYAGNYSPPEHAERIRLRNLSLSGRGIAVTGDDNIDNANAGGGAPDGGIWMGGSYAFETDVNCNVTKGKTLIFYAYEYDIGGTVQKDGTFNLTWSGQGSAGEMRGKVEADNTITGKFFHPAPDSFVYGVLSGTFTPLGKI